MRALVARRGTVAVEERAIPEAGPTDVVVRTTVASLCSGDVACVTEEAVLNDGTILGHEAVGVVHQLGSLVTGLRVGQRVTAIGTTPCGRCSNCQRGFGGHCRGTVWGGWNSGVTRDGSLAEYFLVPDAELNLAKIPDSVSDDAALCLTDSLSTGATGPEAAGIPLGGTVVVFGQGHVGLGATATARLLGAGLVIAVKNSPGREEISTGLGADHVLNGRDHDPLGTIMALTDGHGADCVIEATGVASVFPKAVKATRTGGVVAVLSSYTGPPDTNLHIPLADWGWGIGDKTIISTFAQTGSERLTRLLRLVGSGRVDPTPLLTHTYSINDAARAFEDLVHRRAGLLKPRITFV